MKVSRCSPVPWIDLPKKPLTVIFTHSVVSSKKHHKPFSSCRCALCYPRFFVIFLFIGFPSKNVLSLLYVYVCFCSLPEWIESGEKTVARNDKYVVFRTRQSLCRRVILVTWYLSYCPSLVSFEIRWRELKLFSLVLIIFVISSKFCSD